MRKILALVGVVAAAMFAVVALSGGSASAGSLTCNGVYHNSTWSSVLVPPNGSCTMFNSKVSGGVTVSNGAAFQTCDTAIGGGLSATGAYLNMDHSSSIGGSLSINKSGLSQVKGLEIICDGGDNNPDIPSSGYSTFMCPHYIGGSVTIANAVPSDLDVTLGECGTMWIGGPVLVANNNAQVEIFWANINGNLTCVNNHPPAVYDFVNARSISGCVLAI